jgi:hypothetical protein
VTTPGGQFVIEDTYWAENDYVDAVEQAGLNASCFKAKRLRAGSVSGCVV